MTLDLFDYARNKLETESLRFNGSDYSPIHDKKRLTGQILRVYDAMKGGQWLTLAEIASITGDPEASVSAQARNLRKKSFNSHLVEKRTRGNRENGLFEYKLTVND